MAEEIDFEFEILSIVEKKNNLVVETECKYGKKKFGLSLKSKYIDPKTNEPYYVEEIKQAMYDKFSQESIEEVEIEIPEKLKKIQLPKGFKKDKKAQVKPLKEEVSETIVQ